MPNRVVFCTTKSKCLTNILNRSFCSKYVLLLIYKKSKNGEERRKIIMRPLCQTRKCPISNILVCQKLFLKKIFSKRKSLSRLWLVEMFFEETNFHITCTNKCLGLIINHFFKIFLVIIYLLYFT